MMKWSLKSDQYSCKWTYRCYMRLERVNDQLLDPTSARFVRAIFTIAVFVINLVDGNRLGTVLTGKFLLISRSQIDYLILVKSNISFLYTIGKRDCIGECEKRYRRKYQTTTARVHFRFLECVENVRVYWQQTWFLKPRLNLPSSPTASPVSPSPTA